MTGATGFVGGALARLLRDGGHEVRALVRDPARAGDLAGLGVELVAGDLDDTAALDTLCTDVDGLFHVAGWYKIGVRDRSEAAAINVDGTRHVLELMEELGIAKGVYTSTLAVNSDTHGQVVDESYRFRGRHVSLYDQTKADAHRVAEAFIARGVPLVIVQPGLVYGPGDTSGVRTTWIQFLERRLPLVPTRTAFCWGHVHDIARGHVLAMERGTAGRNYFVCGPVHTLEEAIRLASNITGIPAPRVRAHPVVIRTAARLAGLVEPFVHLPPAYTSEGLRVIGGVTYLGSAARARQELGWTARPLRDGLIETLRHEMMALGMAARF